MTNLTLNKRCHGITNNLTRCKRNGHSFFCKEHRFQPIYILFTAISTIPAFITIFINLKQIEGYFTPKKFALAVPGSTEIEKSLNIAKMEGAYYKHPSKTKIVSYFYVRPCLTHNYKNILNGAPAIFALVSASPFGPIKNHVFNAGSCRFLGKVKSYDPATKNATFGITTISCAFGYNYNYVIQSKKDIGYVYRMSNPLKKRIRLTNNNDCYSVKNYKKFLIEITKKTT